MRQKNRPSVLQISYLKIPLGFAFHIFFGDILTLIVEFLTFGKSYLNLHETSLKINLERHYGVTFLGDLTRKLPYLISMQKKLSRTERIPVEDIALLIRTYVHADDTDLVILYLDIRFLDTALTLS